MWVIEARTGDTSVGNDAQYRKGSETDGGGAAHDYVFQLRSRRTGKGARDGTAQLLRMDIKDQVGLRAPFLGS